MSGTLIVEVASLEAATELARGCPILELDGSVEVRPVDLSGPVYFAGAAADSLPRSDLRCAVTPLLGVWARWDRAQALGADMTNRQLGDMRALSTWLVPCSVAARHCRG